MDHLPRDRRRQVAVVFPCLNEAASVGLVVRQARDALAAAGLEGEVVVADNGSTDGSQRLAAEAGARVVHQPIRGYGAALQAGIEAAESEVVVMADADATYPLERIGELVAPVRDGKADMVLGARWLGATLETMPFLHRFVGTPLLTWLVRRAGGPPRLTDSQSGFRAFRRQAVIALGLRSTGMEYASEMLIIAGRAGWRIQEIDTGYRERIGESKLDTFRDGWRHLKTIVLLAPDLIATYPGVGLLAGGTALSSWSFVDATALRPGSPGWQLSFLGAALLILGAQAFLVGVALSVSSPIAFDGRTRRPAGGIDLLRSVAILGGWLAGVGLLIGASLILVWAFGLGTPPRGLQLALLAQSLFVVGASALGYAGLASLLRERRQRWGTSSGAVASGTDTATRRAA